jgi:hypothetical protein
VRPNGTLDINLNKKSIPRVYLRSGAVLNGRGSTRFVPRSWNRLYELDSIKPRSGVSRRPLAHPNNGVVPTPDSID